MTCIRRSPAKRRVRADDDHTDHADHIPGVRTARQGAIGARALSTGGHDDFNQGQISCRRPGSDHFIIKGALVGFGRSGTR